MVSALHHSRDVGPATNKAPRGQKKTAEVEEAGLDRCGAQKNEEGRSNCPRLPPFVLFLPAQLALGALDILSMPGACFDSGYIPSVSLGGFGATPCFRQSLARFWVLLRSTRTMVFWETTLCSRISAMLGTTVGTCTASAVSVHAASSTTTVVWLVLLVTMPLGCVPLGWRRPRF